MRPYDVMRWKRLACLALALALWLALFPFEAFAPTASAKATRFFLDPLEASWASLPDHAEAGRPVSFALDVSGGSMPYVFTLIDDDGATPITRFTFTPEKEGVYELAVQVSDADGQSVLLSASIPVLPSRTETPEEDVGPIKLSGATAGTQINVRAEPTTQSEAVAVIEAAGTALDVLASVEGEDGTWFRVRYGDVEGYIRGDLLTVWEAAAGFEQSAQVNGVTVTVTAAAGVFPADAALSVTRVPFRAQREVDAAVEQQREEDVNVAVSYTFDIKVLDVDGGEIDFAGQDVQIGFTMTEVADQNLETRVYHVSEDQEADAGLTATALDVVTEEETVTVTTDGFSYYTVEFTYGNLQYVMEGDTTVPLSEIMEYVGLVGEATAVEVSNSALFSAEQDADTGEWFVTAHQPFLSDEWMMVTIGGIDYEIVVTDDDPSTGAGSFNPAFAADADIATYTLRFPVASANSFANVSSGDLAYSSSDRTLYTDVDIPAGAPYTLAGSATFVYKNAAMDYTGNDQYDVRVEYSNITVYPRISGAGITDRIRFVMKSDESADTLKGGIPLLYVKSANWNQRLGVTMDVRVYITPRGVSTPVTDGTFICTVYDVNITRSDGNFGSGNANSGIVEGTGHYNFAESVKFGDTPGPVYYNDASRVFDGRYVGSGSAGVGYLSEIAATVNASGVTFNVWSSDDGGKTRLYLLPDGITYSITSSSTEYGRIDTRADGGVVTDYGSALTRAKYTGASDTLDIPYAKDVTYTMTPKPGYILHKLYVDGSEASATPVKDGKGKILYYTYTLPGKTDPDDRTIHVTWQPAVEVNVKKTWDDFDNRYSTRPGSVSVDLEQDGAVCESATLSDATGWEYVFDVPKYANYDDGADLRAVGDDAHGSAHDYGSVTETLPATSPYVYEEVTPHSCSTSQENRTSADNVADTVDIIRHGITNRVKTAVLTVEKKITGNMGNKNDMFSFNVTANGVGEASCRLADSDTWGYTLPVGVSYTVDEIDANRDGYTTAAPANASGTLNGDQTVTFTNERILGTPTGVQSNNATMLWLLTTAAALTSVAQLLKRRRAAR